MYTRDSVVAVRPFSRQVEGHEIIIGNAESGIFLSVPPEAVELLEQLASGKSIGQVSDLYEKEYGEVPDINELLRLMESKGMVAPISDSSGFGVTVDRSLATVRQANHYGACPQKLPQRLLGRGSIALWLLIVFGSMAATVQDSWLRPKPADLYFPDSRALNWIILILATYTATFLHELGHLAAARAAGISSRIGLGHRLWYLVAETDLSGLWAVSKRQRYLPLLAGILVDVASGAFLVLLLFLYRQDLVALSTFWLRLLRAFVVTYWLRVGWQFFLFVRTDIYYVIATLFNCKNLLGDTEVFLRNLVAHHFIWIRVEDQSVIPPEERRIIRLYAFLWVAGRLWALYALLFVTVPIGLSYLSGLGTAFRVGYDANSANFLDAVVLATLFLLPTIGGLTLWIAGMARRRKA